MKLPIGDDLIPRVHHIIFRHGGQRHEIFELKSFRVDVPQPGSVKWRMTLRVREHAPQATHLFLVDRSRLQDSRATASGVKARTASMCLARSVEKSSTILLDRLPTAVSFELRRLTHLLTQRPRGWGVQVGC